MSAPSRRDLLKLAALGAAGLLSLDLLAACSATEPDEAAADSDSLPPFRSTGAKGKPTGLPARVAWASTADSEFFLALGRGMQGAATDRGVEYVTATSGNDPGKHVDQMSALLRQGVGSTK